MEQMIAGNVCRLCLWKTSPLIPILSSNNLVEKIMQLIPIEIHPGNGLSQFICGECLYKVELFSEFKISSLKCDLIQQDYKRLWQKQLMSERDEVICDEKFCRTLWPVENVKPELESNETPQPVTRSQSEPAKIIEVDSWPTEIDHEEEMTTKDVQMSTSLYARTPCTGAPGCPYICRYCKKEFSVSTALTAHEKKHVDNVCMICDEKFNNNEALCLHLRKDCFPSKVSEDAQEAEEGNFECNICKRCFRSSIALWRHCVCLYHNYNRVSSSIKNTEVKNGDTTWQLRRTVGRPRGSASTRGGIQSRGRGGRKMVFRSRSWIYEKTPCDVCGKIFMSSHGMLIHRKHVHK